MAKGIIIHHPGKIYRRLSLREWSLVVRLYKNGSTASKLARHFRVSTPTITSGLRRRNLTVRGSFKRPALNWPKIKMMYTRGKSARFIGRAYDVQHSSIVRGLARRGISIRHRQTLEVNLSGYERAYIAGLFDGEGTIVIGVNKQNRKGSSHWIGLSVANTDQGIINYLHKKMGGSVSCNLRSPLSIKPVWRWGVTTRHALVVINLLLPYLRIKRNRALLAIKLYKRIDRYPRGRILSEFELSQRENIRSKIKKLNGRGVFVNHPDLKRKRYDYMRQFRADHKDAGHHHHVHSS